MLIPNPKTKLSKNPPTKSYIKKTLFKMFFYNFYRKTFSQFCLRIWNQRIILRILVPILTYPVMCCEKYKVL